MPRSYLAYQGTLVPVLYAKYSIRTNQLYFTEEMISENRSRRNTKALLIRMAD